MDSWVIFDADNTLWDIEHLYDDARTRLVEHVSMHGYSRLEVENYQRERDKKLVATYGYSACRFARSFEDTVLNFIGEDQDSIIHCRMLAMDVFEKSGRITHGLDRLLALIKEKFRIGIVTAGEKWVQERRLSNFHLMHLIDQVKVVEKKTDEVLLQFIKENSISVSESWFVGDSLKSDVIPAKKVGLKAVLYSNHNWVENEYVEGAEPDYIITKLMEISELLRI